MKEWARGVVCDVGVVAGDSCTPGVGIRDGSAQIDAFAEFVVVAGVTCRLPCGVM